MRILRYVFKLGLCALVSVLFSSCACVCGAKKAGPPDPSLIARDHFDRDVWKLDGRELEVGVTNTEGPPVLLMHPITGLTDKVLLVGQQLSATDPGYRVYVPRFFGKWGGDGSGFGGFVHTGFSCDWKVFAKNRLGPIEQRVGALCDQIYEERGQQVVVIGTCLTANMAIAMLDRPSVRAAVACQPALPMVRCSTAQKRALAIDNSRLGEIKLAVSEDPGKQLLAFRYVCDDISPQARMTRLHDLLGEEHFTCFMLARGDDKVKIPDYAEHIPASKSDGHSTLVDQHIRCLHECQTVYQKVVAFLDQHADDAKKN